MFDERTPLLNTPPSEVEQRLVEDETALKPEVERSSVMSIVVYMMATLLALVLVVGIIIGYVNAADKDFDLAGALKKALGGGLSGAAAMVLQVLTLMPLRTVMNYQYRFGTSTTTAIQTLYAAGGYSRYYQGLLPALIQGPTSRFGDTAANAGILALLESNAYMKTLPNFVKTVFASVTAALFRMILTPIDTVKTTLQTQGRTGMQILKERVKVHGPGSLFWGAFATAAATFVGHYPWFAVYNQLSVSLPTPPPSHIFERLCRQAFVGFCASVVSDTVSNSLRVVKTYRQVNEVQIGYVDAARRVVQLDGWKGLFGRGLKTRILANGAQGIMFSILWKLFMDLWDKKTKSG